MLASNATAKGNWYEAGAYSTITVLGADSQGNKHPVKLRAKGGDQDGLLNRGLPVDGNSIALITFDRADNRALPDETYSVEFLMRARGWHDETFSRAIKVKDTFTVKPLSFDVLNLNKPSINYVEDVLNRKSHVYFYIPIDGTHVLSSSAISRGDWYQQGAYSTLSISASNNAGEKHIINLRAKAGNQDGVINRGMPVTDNSIVRIYFDSEDNLKLPSGTYSFEFFMHAEGWHDKSFSKLIKVKDRFTVEPASFDTLKLNTSSNNYVETALNRSSHVYFYVPIDGKTVIESSAIKMGGWYESGEYSTMTVSATNQAGEKHNIQLRAKAGDKNGVINRGLPVDFPLTATVS